MTTPRAFIIRHGETEWSLNGRHTGSSDIPLTPNGEARIRATGKALLGGDRLIVPGRVAHIYVSPRHRARRTLELLDVGCRDRLPWQQQDSAPSSDSIRSEAKVQITEGIREWDYGDYEGLTSREIREKRAAEEAGNQKGGGGGGSGSGKEQRGGGGGGGGEWDIWRDGCPGGESPADVTRRLDALIAEIRERWHGPALRAGKGEDAKGKQQPAPSDVLLVAHGHILRAFAMRWIGRELSDGVSLLLEAGGVGTLSYEHGRVEEPAILLGGAFMVDLIEGAEKKS